jgi:hypothetical protein
LAFISRTIADSSVCWREQDVIAMKTSAILIALAAFNIPIILEGFFERQ